jgi:hypothetical protein
MLLTRSTGRLIPPTPLSQRISGSADQGTFWSHPIVADAGHRPRYSTDWCLTLTDQKQYATPTTRSAGCCFTASSLDEGVNVDSRSMHLGTTGQQLPGPSAPRRTRTGMPKTHDNEVSAAIPALSQGGKRRAPGATVPGSSRSLGNDALSQQLGLVSPCGLGGGGCALPVHAGLSSGWPCGLLPPASSKNARVLVRAGRSGF